MSWLVWLAALLEYLFLCESGARREHGNFSWGYCFALYLIYAVSTLWLYRNLKEWHEAGGIRTGSRTRGLYLLLALLLLCLHLYFGIEFAQIVFQGGSFY